MYQVGCLQLVCIYKQDVYMYMSYVEALIWKGPACYEGPWVWPVSVS